MVEILEKFYECFYNKDKFKDLREVVEVNHKILIEKLSTENKKLVLEIIDALDLICLEQSKDSFKQGLKLGIELTTELQNYDHSMEQKP